MKKKILSLARSAITPIAGLFFAALLFTSCSKNEMDDLRPVSASNSTSVPWEKDSKNMAATGIQAEQQVPLNGMISISHGECFGMCPSYSVSVSKDGIVTYIGKRNVGVIGTVTYNINPDIARELALNMESGGFFGFQDHYNLIPDGQRNVTSLILDGRIKVVVDYGVGIPAELRAMRIDVEKALNLNRFINGSINSAIVTTK